MNRDQRAIPDYVRQRIAEFGDIWLNVKGRELDLAPSLVSRFWRVVDHHEWWMVESLIDQWVEKANTVHYLIKVLETDSQYDKFTKTRRFQTGEAAWQREQEDERKNEVERPNPFLQDRVTKRSGQMQRLGEVGWLDPE